MPRVTTKGQVTIPKEIREQFGLRPGQLVEFQVLDGRVTVTKARDHTHLKGWVGALEAPGDVDDFIDDLRGDE
jgi:antitoxin PrlF